MKIITAISLLILGISLPDLHPRVNYENISQEINKKVYRKGERLFMKNCKACHHPGMVLKGTAPPLGGVTSRYDKKWLYKFTRNSYQMYLKRDAQAVRLLEENNMSIMTPFPDLTNIELDAIYYFIEERYKESTK